MKNSNYIIVIAEDSATLAKNARNILIESGYTIPDPVFSETELRRLVNLKRPNLVLLSPILGDSNVTRETTEWLKTVLRVPILYLIAPGDDSILEDINIDKPFDYLYKPFKPQELVTLVRWALYYHNVEKKIIENEQRLMDFMASSSDGFLILDGNETITDYNLTALNIFGREDENLNSKKATALSPLFGKSEKLYKYIKISDENTPIVGEEMIRHPKQGNRFYSVKSFKTGDHIGIVLSDVTKYKMAISNLQEQGEQYKGLVDFIPEIVYKIDPKGYFTYLNQSVNYLGYKPEELIGKHFTTIIEPSEERQITRSLVLAKYKGKNIGDQHAPKLFDERRTGKRRTKHLEVKVRLKPLGDENETNNSTFFGEVTSTGYYNAPLHSENKEFLGTIGIIKDITERKMAEEEIRILSSAVSQSIDGVVITDLEPKIIYANQAFASIHHYSPKELTGMKASQILTESEFDKLITIMAKVKTEGSWEGEMVHRRNDGVEFPTYSSITLLRNNNEKPSGLLCVCRDITERKIADEKIRNSLREKEVLLKEIHHRVKNNLQVISSLLRIQSGYIRDDQIADIFKDTQNRVQAMALIHEKLYRSNDLARIDFSKYIQSLITNLFDSYRIYSSRINMEIKVDDILLNLDTAIPVGLIINELLSNSLKHAFPPDTGVSQNGKSKILIELKPNNNQKPPEPETFRTKNKNFTLIVSDNGIGFPKEINFRETDTLGLQVVITLVEQLGGKIELMDSVGLIPSEEPTIPGTTFKITF